ncbi:cysteine desulfurase, putative [Babesia ovis]|uniref:Cysteine desulfurase, putative n=1 Tax=Babesia ovis TaxID=5869 RepID=A0A9W5TDH3_BABOV|nr:cysteine desulfurase, putative [Babesia ovis]
MTGQAAASGGNPDDAAAPESLIQQMRTELMRSTFVMQKVGIERYCSCDSSEGTIITTLYDTGESSIGVNREYQSIPDDVDCTFGTAACHDFVLVRNHERFHSESAVPALYTYFQEDGTPVRYVYDFTIYTPKGDKMARLDHLGRSFSTLVLTGKLKPVGTAHDDEQAHKPIQQMLPDEMSTTNSKLKQQKKGKTVSVRINIVDFFIDTGYGPANFPAAYVVSEHDIYYRLDKAASRYLGNFEPFLLIYNLSLRIAKAFKYDRNYRLASILAEVAAGDSSSVATWGETMHLPGFSNEDAYKIIEILYSECLYQHIFQQPCRTLIEDVKMTNADKGVPMPDTLVPNGVDQMDFADVKAELDNLSVDMSDEITDMHTAMEEGGSDQLDYANMGINEEDYIEGGVLMGDIMEIMREYQPLCFFDEDFVVPEHITGITLGRKYKDSFKLPDSLIEATSLKRSRDSIVKGEDHQGGSSSLDGTPYRSPKGTKGSKLQKSQVKRGPKGSRAYKAVQIELKVPPPEPVEIKSKVSGRIIKRNSKLADAEEILRITVDEHPSFSKRGHSTSAVDESLVLRHQILVETEKRCNGLALPADFEYNGYNTTSEVSGDEALNEPIALINDCHVDLKDARYYSRDIPLRTLRFYGADDILDIATTCRQLSASPSNVDPLLPKFTFDELERSLLYTTSVDVFRPLEPSTFVFYPPQCLCDFLEKNNDWFAQWQKAQQKVDDLYSGLIRCLVEYSRVDGFEYRVKMIRDAPDLSDKKKDAQERELKAGVQDSESLVYFLSTHGGCLYRGRFRHISPDSDVQIPYINSVRWNKRFKRVERLLAGVKSHKYTNIGHEYLSDGILITVDSRLDGVPLDVLMNGTSRVQDYRIVYPSNVFEVLPTYTKKFQVWQAESVPEELEPTNLIEKLNTRLGNISLSLFTVERVSRVKAQPIMGFGFREPPSLLNADIVMRPEMLRSFTWSCVLRIYLFYAFYSCRNKFVFKLNSVLWGDVPSGAVNSLEDEYDEEDEDPAMKSEDESKKQEDIDVKDSYTDTKDLTKEITNPYEEDEDDEEEDEEEEDEGEEDEGENEEDGVRSGRRRGWGLNRYSPYYEFEVEWYPDEEKVNQLFQGATSAEAVKVVMEKLRTASYFELEVRDRLVLLKWLSELLTYHPDAKRFIDLRNDEFYLLKASLTKSDVSQNSVNAASQEGQGEDPDKSTEDDKAEVSDSSSVAVKSENEETVSDKVKGVKKGKKNNKKLAEQPETNGTDSSVVETIKTEGVEDSVETTNEIDIQPSAADVKLESDGNQEDSTASDSALAGNMAQSSINADAAKKKKPKEILRDLAELEDRYLQRNVHQGRDRFYNDYYYFGPELGCRIYVRTLPQARFTAQRSSIRAKHIRRASFGPDKFRFDLNKYAKQLEEDRLFGIENKRGRYKRAGAKEKDVTDNKEVEAPLSTQEAPATDANNEKNDPPVVKDEFAMQLVRRKKQKGRKPRMAKPRLRRSREFFDRQPTKFDNVQEYLNYLINIPPRLCWAVMDTPKDIRMFIERLSPMTTNERALQSKLLQLEPELKALYHIESEDIGCWRAPTPYGQVLTSLVCGLQSYIPQIKGIVESTLMRYPQLNGLSSPDLETTVDINDICLTVPNTTNHNLDGTNNSEPNSFDGSQSSNGLDASTVASSVGSNNSSVSHDQDKLHLDLKRIYACIVGVNQRLVQFLEDSTQKALASCCGELGAISAETITMIELVILFESIIANYCDWVYWTSLRADWQSRIDALYREVQSLGSGMYNSYVSPDTCACATRNGALPLSTQEKLLLHVIEELGLWLQYVYVFNQGRIDLFSRYRLFFRSYVGVDSPTLLGKYLSHFSQGSIVYMFGGYKQWLMSLKGNDIFPKDLLTEMLREYCGSKFDGDDAALLRSLPTLVPQIPVETLEAHVESVWFLEVPNYGRLARLALRSVSYKRVESEEDETVVTPVEGMFVPHLQSVAASLAVFDRTRQTKKPPEEFDYALRGDSHESQRFVVYAPLDVVDRASEFILPLTFMAEHLGQIWRQSMRCMWRGRQAHVRHMCYGAADLWRVLQVDTGSSREMVNLWEVSTV